MEALSEVGLELRKLTAAHELDALLKHDETEPVLFGLERGEALKPRIDDNCETDQERFEAWTGVLKYAFGQAMDAKDAVRRKTLKGDGDND